MEGRGSQGSCSTPWNEPEHPEGPNEKAWHQEIWNVTQHSQNQIVIPLQDPHPQFPPNNAESAKFDG